MANAYCENNLKRHCIQMIKQGITISNAAYLYSVAIEYNAKVAIAVNALLNYVTIAISNKCDVIFIGTRGVLFQVRLKSHDSRDTNGEFRQTGREHGKNFYH